MAEKVVENLYVYTTAQVETRELVIQLTHLMKPSFFNYHLWFSNILLFPKSYIWYGMCHLD